MDLLNSDVNLPVFSGIGPSRCLKNLVIECLSGNTELTRQAVLLDPDVHQVEADRGWHYDSPRDWLLQP